MIVVALLVLVPRRFLITVTLVVMDNLTLCAMVLQIRM